MIKFLNRPVVLTILTMAGCFAAFWWFVVITHSHGPADIEYSKQQAAQVIKLLEKHFQLNQVYPDRLPSECQQHPPTIGLRRWEYYLLPDKKSYNLVVRSQSEWWQYTSSTGRWSYGNQS